MKKTILLFENDPAVVEQFFTQLGDKYTIITSSNRNEDLENHIMICKPQYLVYGLSSAGKDDIENISAVQKFMSEIGTKLCITGTPFNCDYFVRNSILAADMMIMKPMKTSDIIATLESVETIETKIDTEAPIDQESEETAQKKATSEENPTGENAAPPTMDEVFQTSLDAMPQESSKTAAESSTPQQRKHVLVIDDNPMMLKIIKQHLHDMYDVATAPSGEIGLKFLETKTTNLILLDFEMPGLNGPQVLKLLRNNPRTRNIPVVFLTGTKDKQKVQQALLMKPQGYLLKPIDKVKLIAMIKSVIG